MRARSDLGRDILRVGSFDTRGATRYAARVSIVGRFPVDPTAPAGSCEAMLRAQSREAARAWRHWRGDGAVIGVSDDGRIATAPGGRICAFDGRIDNADELRSALGVPDRDAAALVLASHARWGDAFAGSIIGDYACAIWEGTTRCLTLAVDPMGLRPLHYHLRTDGSLLLASEPRALLAEPGVPHDWNERRAAQWLAVAPPDPADSFFAAIARVPPGSIVTWQDGRLAISRWWDPHALPMLRLRSHGEYAEAVRAALDTAVAARVVGETAVATQLSGGLDSASVTALAARRVERVTAFTAAPRGRFGELPGRFGDEWDHAASLAARYANVDHVRVANDAADLIEVIERRTAAQDSPQFNLSNLVWVDAIDARAAAAGHRVLLTGAMGNITFSYDGANALSAALRRGRLVGAVRVAATMRRHGDASWLRIIAQAADLLPPVARARLRGIAGRAGMELREHSAIAPAFAGSWGLSAASSDARSLARGDSRAARLMALARSGGMADSLRATRRLYGVDTRDPTMDRRLFELCLTIPDEQFMHMGVPRAIARTAMADLLPPMIRDERRRGAQAADWAAPFEAALPALRSELARQRASRAAPRWLDLDRMTALIDGWPGAEAAHTLGADYLAVLSRGLAVGHFARVHERSNG